MTSEKTKRNFEFSHKYINNKLIDNNMKHKRNNWYNYCYPLFDFESNRFLL